MDTSNRQTDRTNTCSDERDTFLYPSKALKVFNRAFFVFAINVLKPYNRICFGLKVTGRHNLQEIDGGAITICNHVNMLDCTMIGGQIKNRHIYFPTLNSNLNMPFVGFFVKYLGGFPISESASGNTTFYRRVKTLLERGDFVHFYPEGELVPYDTNLRNFHRGAFVFAYSCNVPVVPMVITYREKDGIRRIFRRKPSLNLEILPPIYPDINKARKEEVSRLIEQCKTAMTYLDKSE